MADASMYVINPVFQTRSFDDYVKPLQMYVTAYKEQEAKIEDMTDKAAALEHIANQDPESQTAALYRDMSDKIKGLRDDLITNGLVGTTRSRVLDARRMYSANSAEITRRYQDMQKYRERMETMYDKDNSIVFSPESLEISLDLFAGGNRPKIKAISGNEIMARGAAIGKRLTSQIFGDGVEGTVAGEQFWKFYKENGMNDDALAEALRRIEKEDKFSLVKKVIDGVYSQFADFYPEDQQILKNKFIEGVYTGSVYSRDVSYQPNGEYINAAQREAIRQQDEQLELSRAESNRQDIALQLQALSGGYTLQDGKLVKNLAEPDVRVVKNDDGSATIVSTPYLPDGTLDRAHATGVHVDKNGNMTSVGAVNSVDGSSSSEDTPGVVDQTPSAKTDLDILRAKQEDPESYVTWTYKGQPRIMNADKDGSTLVPLTNMGRTFKLRIGGTEEISPLMDWANDLDSDLGNTEANNFTKYRTDKRWRKWIRTDEQHMPSDVRAQYYKAKNEFLRETKGKGNMKNYEVYYVLDITKPNRPVEFRFQSIGSKENFTKATTEEARGIEQAKVAINLCKQAGFDVDSDVTKQCIETAYKVGCRGQYVSDLSFKDGKPCIRYAKTEKDRQGYLLNKAQLKLSSNQSSKQNNTVKTNTTTSGKSAQTANSKASKADSVIIEAENGAFDINLK